MFYGFGRELSSICPHDPQSQLAREFLLAKVEEFKKQFPNLSLDHPSISNMRVEAGSRKINPNAFFVKNVRNGFSKGLNKMNKL